MTTIGDRLRELRILSGYSVDFVSKKISVTNSSIYNYENNHREMNYKVLNAFADLYNVSIDYILNGDDSIQRNNNILSSNLKLDVIGNIPAGTPISAISSFEGEVYIPAPIFMKYGSDLFALRVHGDSMSKVLHDKAIAIIKKQSMVENGEIAVILVDHQDATLKRFYRLDDETVVLKPDSYSDDYKPEIIDLKKQNIEILGKLIWSCSDEY